MKRKKYNTVEYIKSYAAFWRTMKGLTVALALLLGGQAAAQSHVKVDGNVFGGGNAAPVTGTSSVTLQDDAAVGSSVFGGGNMAGVTSTATVNINGGTVGADHADTAGVYGGCNAQGSVGGAISVNINAGTLGTSTYPLKGIFGGGYGPVTTTGAGITVTIGNTTGTYNPTIYGDVYGGSALGSVNNSTSDLTKIDFLNGTLHGSVYGGGLGVKEYALDGNGGPVLDAHGVVTYDADSTAAVVKGNVQVNIGSSDQSSKVDSYGYNYVDIDGKVFGCNNYCGSPLGDVAVHIYHTKHVAADVAPVQTGTPAVDDATAIPSTSYALDAVYGGGNLAHYAPTSYTGGTTGKVTSVHIHGCENTIQYVYGGGNAANTTANSITIDGGRFEKIFGGGNGEVASLPAANVTEGDATTLVKGGVYNYIFGGSNTKGDIEGDMDLQVRPDLGECGLEIVGNLYGGGNLAPSKGGSLTVECGDIVLGNVYGGANAAYVDGDVTLTMKGGTGIQYVFGGSREVPAGALDANGYAINGNVTLNLYGGEFVNAFGGSDASGNIKGTITVNVADAGNQNCPLKVDTVYGGGKDAPYTPQVASRANSPKVYVKNVKSHASASSPYNKVYGDVFGGGKGADAIVTANPIVIIGDSNSSSGNIAHIGNNVYGGGKAANVTGNTTVYISKSNTVVDSCLFGGGMAADVNGTEVNLTDGLVKHGVYGGNNASGSVNGDIAVNITGGTVGASGGGSNSANVHGGGYGHSTETTGDVTVAINGASATIWGDVYGGSALGDINDDVDDTVTVTLTNGTVKGSIYGGGLGDNSNAALVYGTVEVTIDGGTVNGDVFGCNNKNGTPKGGVTVTVNSTAATDRTGATPVYALRGVYGGGNLAAYEPDEDTTITSVIVNNCATSIKELYGGGNAAPVPGTSVTINGGDIGKAFAGGNGSSTPAHVGYNTKSTTVTGTDYGTGKTSIVVHGGTVVNLFGGSNSQGNVRDTAFVEVAKDGSCAIGITTLYGGGNVAPCNSTAVTIGCTGTSTIDSVFGGANNADVAGDITLNLNGGKVDRAFGGNNNGGVISGDVEVNVNKTENCDWFVGDVIGGGNLANYSGTPAVTVTAGTVSRSVYGGGNEADVGGGNVLVEGGAVLQGVYGGCNTSGTVSGDIAVSITGGTIGTNATTTANVHGGGYGSATSTTGDVEVTINGASVAIWGDVYGGSALGNVNDASSDATTVTLTDGIINGCLYGGGLGNGSYAALVNGAVQVTVNGGSVKTTSNTSRTTGAVFGCNNVNGAPQSTVNVDIYGTDTPLSGYALAEVYGGGNKASYTGTPVVKVHNCDNSIGELYGGGNAADVAGTSVSVYGGNSIGYVFGGGHGDKDATPTPLEANVTGDVAVNIYGGTIDHVFGGSNSKGTISGTITVGINKQADTDPLGSATACDMKIGDVYGGGNLAEGKAGTITVGCTGDLVTGNSGHAADTANIGITLEGIHNIYGGAKAAAVTNNTNVIINGGLINNVFGGNNESGSITGTVTVTVNKNSSCGWFLGNVYGGGNLATYSGAPTVYVYNGTVTHNVYGGGLGSTATVTGTSVTIGDNTASHCAIVGGNVYGGGDAAAVNGNTVVAYNDNNASSSVGNLFGGGNAANVTGTTSMTMTQGKVVRGVYGGCNTTGTVTGDIAVNINGGTVGASGDGNSANIHGGGYGEPTRANGNVTVNIGTTDAASAAAAPVIYGDIYGGSALGNVNDALADLTTVNINNGNITGDIYGGGLGEKTGVNGGTSNIAALVNGTVHVNIGTAAQLANTVYNNFVSITGNIFGCNNTNGTPKGHVYVDVYETAHNAYNTLTANPEAAAPDNAVLDSNDVHKLIFGEGSTPIAANFALKSVYGGGNMAQYTNTTTGASTHVTIHGCENTIQYVYGGGKAADTKANKVDIEGGLIYQVYGGGDGSAVGTEANVDGNATTTIYGGLICDAFGGSNTRGVVNGAASITTKDSAGVTCVRVVNEVYGGGNQAPGGSVTIDIPCTDKYIPKVFGGAKNADIGAPGEALKEVVLNIHGSNFDQVFGGNNQGGTIYGNVTVNIYGGDITEVFGGCNEGGNITGNIVVNIDSTNAPGNCPLDLDYVYGGGNLISYTPDSTGGSGPGSRTSAVSDPNRVSPVVNVKRGTVNIDVFGGGKGDSTHDAQVKANPHVNIGLYDALRVRVGRNVFGGGNAASVDGNTHVSVRGNNTQVLGNVYGGGNAADVSGDTDVQVGGTVRN